MTRCVQFLPKEADRERISYSSAFAPRRLPFPFRLSVAQLKGERETKMARQQMPAGTSGLLLCTPDKAIRV